jgi:SPP1 family predicted phage head-tail adaptor
MQAGTLYEVITIQQKQVVRDPDFGSEQITWVSFAANIRANCTDVGGAEAVRQGLRVGDRNVKVTIRWRSGITSDMRVLQSDGRIFNIVNALEIPRKRGIEMLCQEYTA